MRFFTPELYIRFNSPNEDEADRAYQEWEKAAEQYAQHLKIFRDRTPSQIQRLAELSLHDCLVLSRVEQTQAGARHFSREFFREFHPALVVPFWYSVAIITVKDEGTIRSLIYCLWDNVRVRPQPEGWRFSKEGEHWLYDEIESVTDDRMGPWGAGYLHRILLSTGVELEIPFTTLFIHEFSLTKISEPSLG
ncbi:hypothetical protein VT84_27240 [Gemmata sp. SH-PL17]|uniref:hypothetical protein n=1 Tax=Gemmata sp. SH-PL17 TaxID=1630693 RepID=UPI0006976205|nr:hypothetical protein [Gemmata sp. SH-PL17]AMV28131.1 hypothetical protein VT84_27240 [Gemmata sp. SH-PL17]